MLVSTGIILPIKSFSIKALAISFAATWSSVNLSILFYKRGYKDAKDIKFELMEL